MRTEKKNGRICGMKKQICIPTYNRPEAVDELLLRYRAIYKELGFNIHIYDSSDNNKTSIVVNKYAAYDGVFYHQMDSDIHSNMKVYAIYKEFAGEDAGYIWVQSDSIRWNEASLKRISGMIDLNEYDFIIPNYRDVEEIGDRIYEDANDFFRDCAWHMTLYGATILKTNILNHIEWDELKAKYGVPDRINFSHVGLYFEQISRMEHFKAFHIGLPKYSLTSTIYKKESGWRRDAFFIHCECWPSVINALPPVYRDKKEVIKKQGEYSGDLTIEGLKRLRTEKILNINMYLKYHKIWKEVADIHLSILLLYSILSPAISKMLLADSRNERKLKKKIEKFCRGYKHIYIYGCGQKGDRFADFFEEMHISYEGFLISRGKNEKKSLRGKPVMEIEDDLLMDKGNGIVIALNELNCKQVLDEISGIDVRAGIFTDYFNIRKMR